MNKRKVEIPNDAIIMLVGIAGSGKSTLAKKVFGEESIISSDGIRKELYGAEDIQGDSKEVFDIFYKRIDEKAKNGEQVVADATNLNFESRLRLYEVARKNHREVFAIVFNIPLELAKKQNSKRSRVVPEKVLERQFANFEKTYKEIEYELPKDHIIDIIPSKKQEVDR